MELILFVMVASAVIVIPGPNVMVIVATTLAHGRRRGLQTVAGTSTAMLIQLAVAALATAWLVAVLATGFVWLKWCGVVYLLVLGLNLLLSNGDGRETGVSGLGTFQRGFWVSLTNPKTILFFSAFLPQFVSPSEPFLLQIALLSLIFWVLAVLLDSCYALLAARLVHWLQGRSPNFTRRFSGLFYLGAGAVLARVEKI